jgi:hypothetical protein
MIFAREVDSLCDLLLRRFPERFQLLEQRQGPGQRPLWREIFDWDGVEQTILV